MGWEGGTGVCWLVDPHRKGRGERDGEGGRASIYQLHHDVGRRLPIKGRVGIANQRATDRPTARDRQAKETDRTAQ